MIDYAQFSAQDLDNLESVARGVVKEYKETGQGQNRPACVFLQEGSHTFRFYPDKDEKGLARVIKRIWIHRGLPINNKKKVWCWEDKRVDALLDEFKEEKIDDKKVPVIFGKQIWQWKSQELGLACIHMFETQDKEWHPAGSTVIALMSKRQIFEVYNFIAELHPEERRKLLDPTVPALGINLRNTMGAGKSNVSVGLAGMRMFELPMPPMVISNKEDGEPFPFEGLDGVYIQEKDKLSDEDWNEFRGNAYAEMIKWKSQQGSAVDATKQGAKFEQPAPQPAQQQQPQPQPEPVITVVSGKQEPVCMLADRIKQSPDMKGVYGNDVGYGKHPTKVNPYCTACLIEEECTVETKKNKAA